MSATLAPDLLDAPLTPEGVRSLRRRFYGDDDAICVAEGETLFALARETGDRGCREWRDFLSETAADLLVHGVEPSGYLSEENAAWLIARLEGRAPSRTEFAALLRVMELSRVVPDRLAAFALGVVRDAILAAEGGPRVDRAAVDALRGALFAATSEGFGHVSRAEAEALFEIAEATAGADNDPSFADLFARAIGNHLLAGPGRLAPSRLQVMSREAWLDQRRTLGAGVLSTFMRMASGAFGVSAREAEPAAPAPAVERVDDAETAWLLARLSGKPAFSRAERALLAFLASEATELPAPLRDLAARAA